MRVEIVTPDARLFTGSADMVIARGVRGEEGFLTDHEPMVMSLGYGELRLYQGDQVSNRFAIFGGFLEFRDNVAWVLSDDAVKAESIDALGARERLVELEGASQDEPAIKEEFRRTKVLVEVARDRDK